MIYPKISVIIPIPPDMDEVVALNSLARLDYPKNKIEIIITIGRHRSIQRNKAIEKVTGEIIYFLDDDTILREDAFKRILEYYKDKKIVGVGGPSLTKETDTFIQKCFGYVLGSYFATQRMSAKFRKVGKVRIADERDLILCNLSFRTSVIKEFKGFNPNLHSGNEENELMNRITRKGWKLIYDPELFIRRSNRKNVIAFGKQIAKYGKGRIEHFLYRPSFFEPLFLIPLLFLIYLVSLLFIHNILYFIPLIIYIVINIISSLVISFRTKDPKTFFMTTFLFFLVHMSYGVGMLIGLYKYFLKEKRIISEPIVKKINLSKIKVN